MSPWIWVALAVALALALLYGVVAHGGLMYAMGLLAHLTRV